MPTGTLPPSCTALAVLAGAQYNLSDWSGSSSTRWTKKCCPKQLTVVNQLEDGTTEKTVLQGTAILKQARAKEKEMRTIDLLGDNPFSADGAAGRIEMAVAESLEKDFAPDVAEKYRAELIELRKQAAAAAGFESSSTSEAWKNMSLLEAELARVLPGFVRSGATKDFLPSEYMIDSRVNQLGGGKLEWYKRRTSDKSSGTINSLGDYPKSGTKSKLLKDTHFFRKAIAAELCLEGEWKVPDDADPTSGNYFKAIQARFEQVVTTSVEDIKEKVYRVDTSKDEPTRVALLQSSEFLENERGLRDALNGALPLMSDEMRASDDPKKALKKLDALMAIQVDIEQQLTAGDGIVDLSELWQRSLPTSTLTRSSRP